MVRWPNWKDGCVTHIHSRGKKAVICKVARASRYVAGMDQCVRIYAAFAPAVGVVQKAATPATTASALRVLDLVDETSVSVSGIGSSSTTTITLTAAGALSSTTAIGAGWNVAYIAPNGQLVQTGSFVASVTNVTTVVINQAILATNSISEIPAGSTIVFTQYPEVLVKIDFGIHSYYSAAATA